MKTILILDIGFGNVRSIFNALKYISKPDQKIVLSNDPNLILESERVVINGVGSFPEYKRKFDDSGLIDNIYDAVKDGKPILGICVGMQILATTGYEFKETKGLDIIPGVVERLDVKSNRKNQLKLPHVGWNKIYNTKGPIFENIGQNKYLYFVHSYVFKEKDKNVVTSVSDYGEEFTSSIMKDNIIGVQFHPERSGPAGLLILENFLKWKP